ncbi:hypothetical protein CPAV1605_466 [seawater metagenome]|uniref:Uncharacterized protein n=1 Tax=seawater metagenome TaxID=1561972 RepID=A0A5E8CHM6_9ZZZZ
MYQQKYLKYKNKYQELLQQQAGASLSLSAHKFNIGDKVKRIKGDPMTTASGGQMPAEAVGLEGEIKKIERGSSDEGVNKRKLQALDAELKTAIASVDFVKINKISTEIEKLSSSEMSKTSYFVLFPKLTSMGPRGMMTGAIQILVPEEDLQKVTQSQTPSSMAAAPSTVQSIHPRGGLEPKVSYPKFDSGDRFVNTLNGKKGTVRRLRNDSHEQSKRRTDPTHHYFHVDYDDGTFETYQSQDFMKRD